MARQRFLREAAITARLQHPGIVPIYGLGHDDAGPFYAMPFIQGQTLQEAIEGLHRGESLGRDPGERSLKFRALLQPFVTVCNTVAYAHDQGVVHRDLKPLNIMLGPYGETLVMDWGLAKRLGAEDPAAEAAGDAPSPSFGPGDLTATGAVLGTLKYMSPEQAKGEPTGPPADIFCLGLVLYAILTGKTAFDEASLQGSDPLKAVREAAVVPPRTRDPAVSRALEAVCLKALAARPEDRYPSARALAEDVSKWLAGEPVSAWREPWGIRTRRWIVRHRTAVTAACTSALIAAAAIGYILSDSRLRAAQRLTESNGRVDALITAQVRSIPVIVDQLGADRRLVRDRLARLARGNGSDTDSTRFAAALALLPDDHSRADFLIRYMLRTDATPDEVLVARDSLIRPEHIEKVRERRSACWAGSPPDPPSPIGNFGPRGPSRRSPLLIRVGRPWPIRSRELVTQNPLYFGAWYEVFLPVFDRLVEPLRKLYVEPETPASRDRAFTLLFDYATRPGNRRQTEDLVALIGDVEPHRFHQLVS